MNIWKSNEHKIVYYITTEKSNEHMKNNGHLKLDSSLFLTCENTLSLDFLCHRIEIPTKDL